MKHSSEQSTDPLDVPDIKRRPFRFLRNRKRFVAVGMLFGFAHRAAYIAFKQPVFESTGKFIVAQAAAPLVGPQPVDDGTPTFISITASRSLINRAIEKADLKQLKSFRGKDANSTILKNLMVQRDTSAGPGAVSNVIVTKYQGPIAEDGKAVLDALYGSLQDFLEQRGNRQKMTIVSPPEIGRKVSPIVPLSLTTGLFFGLLMGALFAFLADRLDCRPRLSHCFPQGENHGC